MGLSYTRTENEKYHIYRNKIRNLRIWLFLTAIPFVLWFVLLVSRKFETDNLYLWITFSSFLFFILVFLVGCIDSIPVMFRYWRSNYELKIEK